MAPFMTERSTQPKREGGATLRRDGRTDTMSSCGIKKSSNFFLYYIRNSPHNFINVELLLPVSLYAGNVTHPDNTDHHSRHFC